MGSTDYQATEPRFWRLLDEMSFIKKATPGGGMQCPRLCIFRTKFKNLKWLFFSQGCLISPVATLSCWSPLLIRPSRDQLLQPSCSGLGLIYLHLLCYFLKTDIFLFYVHECLWICVSSLWYTQIYIWSGLGALGSDIGLPGSGATCAGNWPESSGKEPNSSPLNHSSSPVLCHFSEHCIFVSPPSPSTGYHDYLKHILLLT